MPVLNHEAGASFIGVPVGEEGIESDKAWHQLLLQCGDERNIPKNIKDGSSLTVKFAGYPSEDVVEFLDQAEGQLKYVPGHVWHVYALNSALGPKAFKMADVHQKALSPGRMPDRMIKGELHVVPGGSFAQWKEMKEWLLLTFAKPEQELHKMEKIFRENAQGKKSFEEYASTLTLSLKQFKVQTPDLIILRRYYCKA